MMKVSFKIGNELSSEVLQTLSKVSVDGSVTFEPVKATVVKKKRKKRVVKKKKAKVTIRKSTLQKKPA